MAKEDVKSEPKISDVLPEQPKDDVASEPAAAEAPAEREPEAPAEPAEPEERPARGGGFEVGSQVYYPNDEADGGKMLGTVTHSNDGVTGVIVMSGETKEFGDGLLEAA